MATTGQSIIAIDKATTWGTAVSVNAAGRGLYLMSTGNLVAPPEQLIDVSIGRLWPECIVQGKRVADLTLQGFARFAGPIWELIALCIGSDVSTQIGVSGDYNHVMDLQSNNDLMFFTMAVDLGGDTVTIREIPSFKVSGFTITGSAASILEITIRGIGNNVIESGQVNTTLASVTFVPSCNLIPFDVQVRMNDETDIALAVGNLVQASEFELSFDRNLQADFTTNATLYETAEPFAQGQPTTSLRLLFPKTPITNYTDALADLANGTKKKMDIIITGPATGNGNNFTLTLQFPSLLVENVESPLESDNVQIPQNITFMGTKTSAAPAGMTGITLPFRLTLLNSTATEYDV